MEWRAERRRSAQRRRAAAGAWIEYGNRRENNGNSRRRKMKTYLAVMLGVAMAGSALSLYAEDQPGAAPAAEKKAAMAQCVYVCPDCHMMAMKAGKCAGCQKDMTEMHLLGVKDGQATLCGCSAGCQCDAKGVKEGKCVCGKDVKTMSAKGMYVCSCPGAACCSSMSDNPGKCACGSEMKKVE
jgi:hypothetical protein